MDIDYGFLALIFLIAGFGLIWANAGFLVALGILLVASAVFAFGLQIENEEEKQDE